MAPPPMRDSALSPCFHGCLAFLHRHLPPQSPPSHPLNLSFHSQQQPSPWDCSTIPKLQLPAFGAIHGTNVPVQGLHGCGKNYLILIPFRLPQISCFTHILKCFSSDSDNCPDVGIRPLPQFPHPPRAGLVLLTLLFLPLVPCPTKFCMVLDVLFCCSGTPVRSQPYTVMSEGVFVICPWREMYSTSTHSSAIFFSLPCTFYV